MTLVLDLLILPLLRDPELRPLLVNLARLLFVYSKPIPLRQKKLTLLPHFESILSLSHGLCHRLPPPLGHHYYLRGFDGPAVKAYSSSLILRLLLSYWGQWLSHAYCSILIVRDPR